MGKRFHYSPSGKYKGYSTDTPTDDGLGCVLILFPFVLGFLIWMYAKSWWDSPNSVSDISRLDRIAVCKRLVEEHYGEDLHYIGAGHYVDDVIYIEVDVDNFGPDKRDTPNYENYARCHISLGKIFVNSGDFLPIDKAP